MNASFRSLRRAFAAGALATLTISAGGCFKVEQVAEQPQSGGSAGEGGAVATGEPTLDIAMGDEAGPLDLNVDATLGEVSAADVASSFGANDRVPGVPAERSPNQIPAAPSFPPQPVASEPIQPDAFAPSAVASSPIGGDFSTSPVLQGAEGSAAPALAASPYAPAPGGGFAAPPALSEGFSAPPNFGGFQPPASAEAGSLSPLADPETAAAVAPMEDPEAALVNGAPAAPLQFSPSPAPVVAAEGLQPSFNPAPARELTPSPAPFEEPAPTLAEFASPEAVGAEIVGAPDLAGQTPAPPASDEPIAPGPAPSFGELTPPAVAAQPESLAGSSSLRDAIGAVPVEEEESPQTADLAETMEPAGSPFAEEDFAPRFGPGRHLAGTPSAVGAPEAILTPGAALFSGEEEEPLSGVLAQESPSPQANAIAMQIVDPSAPPPASIRPTANPNPALPAFDPTAGERLSPPPIGGVEDFTPTPPGEGAATGPEAAGIAAPAATGPAPRGLPMPGPARDDATEEEAADNAVPASPATRTPSGVQDSKPKSASTTAEIAEASRDWTDASGSHKLNAAILEYDQGEVRLETPKGERYIVSLSSLSRYDQGYVKGLAEGTLGKPPVERTWTDESGTFTLVGEFVEDAGDAVRIARENGKTFRIAKDELADYDRGYVDGLNDAKVQ
ncbi:MAG TPA: SHD1 domain-containing protein [Pirellulaceae bacterium]|nr:SHD1 domain-containing protein [Pirellulaceae bacterium]